MLKYKQLQIMRAVKTIDLGLPSGILWANKDVGAMDEYECGWRTQFGSTKVQKILRSEFWEKCPFNNGSADYDNDYMTENLFSFVDENFNLLPEYDIVNKFLGGGWRLPTKDNVQELIEHTEIVSNKFGWGVELVSKVNGESILFKSSIWTSTLITTGSSFRYGCTFLPSRNTIGYDPRAITLYTRGVLPPENH